MSKVAARILQAIDQSYIIPAAQRTPDLQRQFQLVANSLSERERDAQDLITYLEAAKLHKELVQRYNPTSTMTVEERTKATARVVGLDVPLAYVPPKA